VFDLCREPLNLRDDRLRWDVIVDRRREITQREPLRVDPPLRRGGARVRLLQSTGGESGIDPLEQASIVRAAVSVAPHVAYRIVRSPEPYGNEPLGDVHTHILQLHAWDAPERLLVPRIVEAQ
jgi:hypothetical protein